MPDLKAARDDLGAFSKMVRTPLEAWQVAALVLATLVTCVVAPRQSGKSRSLAVLALWWAFRKPGQRVLIISAGDEAAKRLLAEVRRIASGSPLLRGSVVDESAGLLTLSNGSEIRSVPASERQIRGWSVDLLLVDEAALVPDDLVTGAAMPTIAARPDARIVMASSATTAVGSFFDHVQLGLQGAEHVRAFAWALTDAHWISRATIEAARASMSPQRFAAEYEGVFASGADSLFPRHLLDRATADVEVPGFDGLQSVVGLLGGVDWGATTDRSALVGIARMALPRGAFVVACAHAWRSGHPLDGDEDAVIGELVARSGAFELLTPEMNGLGLPLAQELERRVTARWQGQRRPPVVEGVHTSAPLKSATYSAVRLAFEQGRLVLPASATDLRRELLLTRVQLLQSGGERIEAGTGHDDLADALMLAAGPYKQGEEWRSRLGDALEREPLDRYDGWIAGRDTVATGGGRVVLRRPVLEAMRVPRAEVRVQSYMDDDRPRSMRAGGMTLTGDHHFDLGEDGKRHAPPGWTEITQPRRYRS
jgi:hypothetical protein